MSATPSSQPTTESAMAPPAGSSRVVWALTLFLTLAIGLGGYAWKGRWDSVVDQAP